MDIKNISFREVQQAQKLSQYYFRIDYYQDKANRVANTFSKYSQQNIKEKAVLKAKNTKILPYLQIFLAKISGLFMQDFSLFHQVIIYGTLVVP